MTDLRSAPRNVLADFIKIYRENPCLWQAKSKDFRNKQKKNVAYQLLVKKLAEFDPNANKGAVLRKINSLRTCFRKEYRKVLKSKKIGANEGAIYVPTLWYYDHLRFLIEQEESRSIMTHILDNVQVEIDSNCEESQEEKSQINDMKSERQTPTNDYAQPRAISPTSDSSSSSLRVPKKQNRGVPFLDIVSPRLPCQVKTWKKYNNFGKHIAEQLRELPNHQAILVTKIINDAIYDAQCRTIKMNSRTVSTVSLKVEENDFNLESL